MPSLPPSMQLDTPLVVPRPHSALLLYFQEQIFVYVADGELRTDHSFYLAGQRFLTLHYEIERPAVARA